MRWPGRARGVARLAGASLVVATGCARERGQVVVLENDVLEAHFVDNGALPSYDHHPEGLNGIARLRHQVDPDRDLFVPSRAGLNYEISTLNGVEDHTWEQTSEPRESPMALSQLGEDSVELYQEPTPRKQVEARLRFTLVEEPAAVDFDFEFTPHLAAVGPKEPWEYDLSVLFASYLHDPDDPHAYVHGATPSDPTPRWLRVDSERHGDWVFVEEIDGTGPIGSWTLDLPVLVGTVAGLRWVLMVDSLDGFGFWYSPDGGMEFETRTPAWDFTLGFDGWEVGETLGRSGRLLLLADGDLDHAEAATVAWLAEQGR